MLNQYKRIKRQPRNIIDAINARSLHGDNVSREILEIEGVFLDMRNALTPVTIKTDLELAQEQKQLRAKLRQEHNLQRQAELAAAAQENPSPTYRRMLF